MSHSIKTSIQFHIMTIMRHPSINQDPLRNLVTPNLPVWFHHPARPLESSRYLVHMPRILHEVCPVILPFKSLLSAFDIFARLEVLAMSSNPSKLLQFAETSLAITPIPGACRVCINNAKPMMIVSSIGLGGW